jgi:hypothetical protein
MTWSTIEEAWGNEPTENFNNYYENYQTNNSQKQGSTQPTQVASTQPTQVASTQPTQVASTQPTQVPTQMQYNNIKNKLFDEKINRLETKLTTNNLSINKKLDNLTLKIEAEIKRVNTEVRNLIETLNNDNSDNTNGDNFPQNMNDIILFVIFGVFMIILMDSMYRILLLKIKKI